MKINILLLILYVISYIICVYYLIGYEDNLGSREAKLEERISIYIYKYILNFPLGFLNWFTDKYLWTTIIFILPNSLIVSFIINKVLFKK